MKVSAVSGALAAVTLLALLAYADSPNLSLATSPPSAQRFSIDLWPTFFPANTATSIGTNEPSCVRANLNGVVDADEVAVDTLEFDVTATGIPASNPMIAYAYTLNYPAPQTRITWAQSMLLYSAPGSGILPDPDVLDTDGSFAVTRADPGPPSAAESGNGVLDRISIQVLTAVPGVYPLTLSGAAHVDTNGDSWAPDFTDSATIGLNTSSPCGMSDLETVSQTASFPTEITSDTDVQIDVNKTVRNNGPFHPLADVRTTFSPPTGCTVNAQSTPVTVNTAVGQMIAGTSVANEHLATVRCAAPGAYQLPVAGCGVIDPSDPGHFDPLSGNNCITTNVNFGVTVQADGGVSLAPFIPPQTITADTPFPISVLTSMSNSGPYSPADFTLSNSSVVPIGCSVTPPAASTHSLTGAATVVGQTWYVNCPPGGPYVFELDYALASASPYVLDPAAANNTTFTMLPVIAEPDADSDGVWDLDETACGVSNFGAAYFPERMNGVDDDGDGQTDEALPAGSESHDCDGDGYIGSAEAHVFQATDRDQRVCGTSNWPADFVSGGIPDSTNKLTVTDLTSFLAPTRQIGTNVGDNPGNVRWDIVPGKGLFLTDINVADLTSLIVTAPAMFGGARAFNGPICTP
ncbi:MAG TPA: hypothetical protein VLS25_03835 [Dehalococcoidia bacterium]|nr:hypothetical protein [Dehalococcoidia bacterium]